MSSKPWLHMRFQARSDEAAIHSEWTESVHPPDGSAQCYHVPHDKRSGQKIHAGQQTLRHQAGAAGARPSARRRADGISPPVEGSGASRCRLAGQTRRPVHQRVLLAPLPALPAARPQDQRRVLGAQIRAERRARRADACAAGEDGLARPCRVGVRAKEEDDRRHHGAPSAPAGRRARQEARRSRRRRRAERSAGRRRRDRADRRARCRRRSRSGRRKRRRRGERRERGAADPWVSPDSPTSSVA